MAELAQPARKAIAGLTRHIAGAYSDLTPSGALSIISQGLITYIL